LCGAFILGSNMNNSFQSHSESRLISMTCLSAALVLFAGCQKTDLGPTTAERLKSAEQRQQTVPDFYVPRKTVDYMSDLKAIKETAAPVELPKKDSNAKDAKTVVAEAKAAPSKAGTSATTVEPAKAPVSAAPVAPPPVVVTTPPRAPEPIAAPAPVVIASAAPTARPAPEVSSLVTVLSRQQPDFPRDAARQGVESGSVRARITINGGGDVSNVTIIQARPLRVFDRSVVSALSLWKFNPGADGRTYDTEVSFARQ
jgi:protein TonB